MYIQLPDPFATALSVLPAAVVAGKVLVADTLAVPHSTISKPNCIHSVQSARGSHVPCYSCAQRTLLLLANHWKLARSYSQTIVIAMMPVQSIQLSQQNHHSEMSHLSPQCARKGQVGWMLHTISVQVAHRTSKHDHTLTTCYAAQAASQRQYGKLTYHHTIVMHHISWFLC